jgi:flagellar hook-basal body complex protein FliE
MEINSLYNVTSSAIQNALNASSDTTTSSAESEDVFGAFLDSAVKNINETNSYISDAENEEIKLAMGETDNTHDLSIALQKASTALQYTVAVRDKFIEAYKTIMNMQI